MTPLTFRELQSHTQAASLLLLSPKHLRPLTDCLLSNEQKQTNQKSAEHDLNTFINKS